MSMGSPPSDDGRNGVELQREDTAVNIEQGECTPKKETPSGIAVSVVTPNATQEGATSDYFTLQPLEQVKTAETAMYRAPRSPELRLAPSVEHSEATATGQMLYPHGAALHPLHIHTGVGRPTYARDGSTLSNASGESMESNTTVTAERLAQLRALQGPNSQVPAYPNQSYAALQAQIHGGYHMPPTLRQRSSHPAQIMTFAAAHASMHQSGARTQTNSPAGTPTNGMWLENGPTTAPAPDHNAEKYAGTYASPFLNSLQRRPVTTTHFADVDVDPITGRKLINHYEIIDELGRGAHGKVKLGRNLNTENQYVAIKIVERYSKRRKLGKLVSSPEDKVKKEVAILKKARHPNVVGLIEVIDDPARRKVYIVLEWVERGEISWRVKGPKEITMIEARRYQVERKGWTDTKTITEQAAVEKEAKRRLARQKRRQLRSFRRVRREAADGPENWSIEVGGDGGSDSSDDDQLSRISTATADSWPSGLKPQDARRGSRAPSPLPQVEATFAEGQIQYLPLTTEPQQMSPVAAAHEHNALERIPTALEGTMIGAYTAGSAQSSRVPSLAGSSVPSLSSDGLKKMSSDEIHQFTHAVFENELNHELEYVPCMSQQNIRAAFRDTLLGLQYLHYQGIVHRDIKPPNLLQTLDRRVKISDFGVSYLGRPLHEGDHGEDVSESEARDMGGDEAKELAKTVGTPAFYAPELCTTDVSDDPPPVTKAIDVWALGITLFCMLFARTPFVDSEYVVMRQIAEEEIYIPRRRLQPVDLKPKSRPTSHGRAFPQLPNGRRQDLDLSYEDIPDDLYDLLKRLLEKDPRKRVTLEEVRHHSWVNADIQNKLQWLDETDPSRQSHGKRIEVSKEDMNTAVVPLFLDRVRSGLKSGVDGLKHMLSGGRSSRGRAQSTASGSGASPVPSAASSSSTISQDGRRQSLRGDESIFTALQKSREGGERSGEQHPLARSVAASPDMEQSIESLPTSDPSSRSVTNSPKERRTPSRPSPLERSKTMMSTAASIRTLRQSDFQIGPDSPPPSPGLPSTPMALDSPGGTKLGGLLGGAGRILKSVRERSSARSSDLRGRSAERNVSQESLDPHGGPSLAVSRAVAAGSVATPEVLRDMTPTSSAQNSAQNSARNSPASSRPQSVLNSPEHLHPYHREGGLLSHKSSISSIASASRLKTTSSTPENRSPMRAFSSLQAPESSSEDWARADDERVRKLVRESKEDSGSSRPTSAWDDRTCPPSPDDQKPKRRESRQMSAVDIDTPAPSQETSPTQNTANPVSSASDYGSAVSMSVSNPSIPSIPSVISEPSSVGEEEEGEPMAAEDKAQNKIMFTTNGTMNAPVEDPRDDVYTADESETALDSDQGEYESSSDSDGGLLMTRRRSAGLKKTTFGAGGGLAAALEAQAEHRRRRGTGLSARSRKSNKSSRSGSNSTMKKINTRESGDEHGGGGHASSLEVPAS